MSKDIFSDINLHGNTLSGAKVTATPSAATDISNKKYVDDMFIEQGLDGFKEATFKVVDISIRNSGVTGSNVCYMNKGWKIFVVTELTLNSRDTYTLSSYLKFGEKEIAFTSESLNKTQAKFLYDISILDTQELFVFDTEEYIDAGSDTTLIVLDNLDYVNFTVQLTAKTITFKGQSVTHPTITLSESVMYHNTVIDYYPVIAKPSPTTEPALDGLDISTAQVPNTNIQTNISESINEVTVSQSGNYDFLILTPQKYTNRRYWYMIIDDDGNALSDKETIVLQNQYEFKWLGIKYKQTVVNIGYLKITSDTKIVIGFDTL